MSHYETSNVKNCVITGGPGVGKTTVLRELKALGYTVVEEAARLLIKEGVNPQTDPFWFQLEVIKQQLSLETMAREENGALSNNRFFDRGVFDNFAYCKFFEIISPGLLLKLAEEDSATKRYSQVFLLDPLPFYVNDAERPETESKAREIHQLIRESYEHLGYSLVPIPVLTHAKERAQYIIKKMEENNNGRML